jgi:hypothetical protein
MESRSLERCGLPVMLAPVLRYDWILYEFGDTEAYAVVRSSAIKLDQHAIDVVTWASVATIPPP